MHFHAWRSKYRYHPCHFAFSADMIKEWLGAGIFTLRHGSDNVERPQWYLQRKTASHIFKKRTFVNLMHEVFLSKSRIDWCVRARWHQVISYVWYANTQRRRAQWWTFWCKTALTNEIRGLSTCSACSLPTPWIPFSKYSSIETQTRYPMWKMSSRNPSITHIAACCISSLKICRWDDKVIVLSSTTVPAFIFDADCSCGNFLHSFFVRSLHSFLQPEACSLIPWLHVCTTASCSFQRIALAFGRLGQMERWYDNCESSS